jgi:hypothetical protein
MIKPLETQKVKFGDKEFVIAYSNRALFAHLRRIEEQPNNNEIVVNYYYDLCRAGAKLEGKEFGLTFDEFYDAIDNYPDGLLKFAEAVTRLMPSDNKKK